MEHAHPDRLERQAALPAPVRRGSMLLRLIFLALLVAAVFVAYRWATAPATTPLPPEMTPEVTPQSPSRGAGFRAHSVVSVHRCGREAQTAA